MSTRICFPPWRNLYSWAAAWGWATAPLSLSSISCVTVSRVQHVLSLSLTCRQCSPRGADGPQRTGQEDHDANQRYAYRNRKQGHPQGTTLSRKLFEYPRRRRPAQGFYKLAPHAFHPDFVFRGHVTNRRSDSMTDLRCTMPSP